MHTKSGPVTANLIDMKFQNHQSMFANHNRIATHNPYEVSPIKINKSYSIILHKINKDLSTLRSKEAPGSLRKEQSKNFVAK